MAKGRKKIEKQEESGDSWLTSYADLITNFLSVFVILFSFAMMNQASVAYKAKMAEEAAAAQMAQAGIEAENATATALPEGDASGTSAPTAQPTLAAESAFITLMPEEADGDESGNTLYEAIHAYIETSGLSGDLRVTKLTDKLILLRVHSSIFFELGSAEIEPGAEPILEDVCTIFVKYQEQIEKLGIEGHTDNLPIKTEQFGSNWELSTARAVNVLQRVLELSGLDPSMFSAVGLGEFHPIADNETEEGRTQNRRVDFIIETNGD
jgi:chemotaxis protein MotB